MIRGVIFDMDGTMFDTERMWAEFWEPALAELGMEYREGLAEAERGTSGEASLSILRQYYGPDCDAEAVIRSLNEKADAAFAAAPVPKKPGLDPLMDWLDSQGIPMAVASSTWMAGVRRNLDGWGMAGRFRALLTGDQVLRSKPDPEIFLRAARALGLEPAECLVLEDSCNGVRAGAAGGFVTVLVPDMVPADEEMRSLCTLECESLNQVLEKLQAGEL